MVWLRRTPNASPVMWVVKSTIRPPSTRAHFECVPGRQAMPPSRSSGGTPSIWVSSPRITSATPELVKSGQAGNQFHPGPIESDVDQRAAEFRGPGRAGQIGRFFPALAAADHAGQQDAVFPSGQPRADLFAQCVAKPSVRHVQDTFRRRLGAREWSRRAPCGTLESWSCPNRSRSSLSSRRRVARSPL